jgi:hypothetical protein
LKKLWPERGISIAKILLVDNFVSPSKMWRYVLILSGLFLQVSHVSAQAQCFSLSTSKVCSAFKGEFKYTDRLDGQVINTDAFSTVEMFDSYLMMHYDNQADYIKHFQSYYECPGYNGTGQRYHISTLCAMFVDSSAAQGCTGKSNYSMCSSAMSASQTALKAMFSNKDICTVESTVETRGKLLSLYDTYMKRIPSKSSSCVAGFQKELGTCGKLIFY